MREGFRRFAGWATEASGSPAFFVISVVGIVIWAATGPFYNFSDTWQLIVNTPTTVLTYLVGILILFAANRQAKESKVVHDELLRAVQDARTSLIRVDEMTEAELQAALDELKRRAPSPGVEAAPAVRAGTADSGVLSADG
jgi:low affinity Fe/Cu permease